MTSTPQFTTTWEDEHTFTLTPTTTPTTPAEFRHCQHLLALAGLGLHEVMPEDPRNPTEKALGMSYFLDGTECWLQVTVFDEAQASLACTIIHGLITQAAAELTPLPLSAGTP